MYLKKKITDVDVDNMRIHLAVRDFKLSAEPVCDFCGDDKPVYVYASQRMSNGEDVLCWRWCSCEDCSGNIDKRQWETLALRIAGRAIHLLPLGMERMLRQVVYHLISEFQDFAVRDDGSIQDSVRDNGAREESA